MFTKDNDELKPLGDISQQLTDNALFDLTNDELRAAGSTLTDEQLDKMRQEAHSRIKILANNADTKSLDAITKNLQPDACPRCGHQMELGCCHNCHYVKSLYD